MKNKQIPDSSITASSALSWYYSASKGRLDNKHTRGSGGSWCPNQITDDKPYLQVDLGALTRVTKLSTQGSPVRKEYTQYFMLLFSDNETKWTTYKQDGKTKVNGMETSLCDLKAKCFSYYQFRTVFVFFVVV